MKRIISILSLTLASLASAAEQPPVVTNECPSLATLNMEYFTENLQGLADRGGLIDCHVELEQLPGGIGARLVTLEGESYGLLLGHLPDALSRSALSCHEQSGSKVVTYSIADALGWVNAKLVITGNRVYGITLNRTMPTGHQVSGLSCNGAE